MNKFLLLILAMILVFSCKKDELNLDLVVNAL